MIKIKQGERRYLWFKHQHQIKTTKHPTTPTSYAIEVAKDGDPQIVLG
jgi:hypothetical protein